MASHFTCADRDGALVSCDEKTWYDHIVDEHPEMANCEEEVQRAVSTPFAVHQDANHSDRKLYYALTNRMPTPLSLGYVRVVVRYGGQGEGVWGQVITAFLCLVIREGDALLWPSSQQQT